MSAYPAKIAAALHEVMQACSYVQKTKRNTFHNYNYAGEGDLLDKLRPAMLNAGLLLIPSGVERSPVDDHGNTHVTVEYTLVHKDGDVWPDKIRAFGTGNDKNSKGGIGDKGTYKALTGANKYLLFKLFQIETGDDPETDEREVEPPAPRDTTPARQQPPKQAAGNPAYDVTASGPEDFAKRIIALVSGAPDAAAIQAIKDTNASKLANLHRDNRALWDSVMQAMSTRTTDVLERAA